MYIRAHLTTIYSLDDRYRGVFGGRMVVRDHPSPTQFDLKRILCGDQTQGAGEQR
jgi:hypothetical protein